MRVTANLTALIVTLVIIFGVCHISQAYWGCPCYKTGCENDTLYFAFCLPGNVGPYYVLYRAEGDPEYAQVELINTVPSNCSPGCYLWGAAVVGWDCRVPYEFQVFDGWQFVTPPEECDTN
jgi:hypothetical protein